MTRPVRLPTVEAAIYNRRAGPFHRDFQPDPMGFVQKEVDDAAKEWIRIGGCGALARGAVSAGQDPTNPQVVQVAPRYRFEIEVVAPRKSLCHAHKIGERFDYPEDLGRICPWLRDAMSGMLRAMEWGAVFPWDYDGTPFKKISDPRALCTEFVRCPDPTANGIVVKITRPTLNA